MRPLVVVRAAEALMVPLQTTTELVGKLKDQQDETARQVALLMQHHLQHLANGGAGAAAPAEPGTPAVPGTPNGRLGRYRANAPVAVVLLDPGMLGSVRTATRAL